MALPMYDVRVFPDSLRSNWHIPWPGPVAFLEFPHIPKQGIRTRKLMPPCRDRGNLVYTQKTPQVYRHRVNMQAGFVEHPFVVGWSI